MLDWTIERLAALSGISPKTLIRFEAEKGQASPITRASLRSVIEAAGIEFIAEDGDGAGLRLRRCG